jgi:hypothetical protein
MSLDASSFEDETEVLKSLFGGLLNEISQQCFYLSIKTHLECRFLHDFSHNAKLRARLSCDYSFIVE